MSIDVARVPFYGMDILTIEDGGEIYVAMKDACNGIGVQWGKQLQRMTSNPILGPALSKRKVKLPEDIQHREITTLPIQYLNGWLMTINPNKVGASARNLLISCQTELFNVLCNYFDEGIDIANTKTSELVGLNNLSSRLQLEIYEQHNPVIRAHLYRQMRDINDALGQPTPDIEHFTRKTETSSNVIDLFEYYRILCVKHDVNHSSDPDVIAIEPESFSGLCQRAFQESLPVAELGRQVKESIEYPYIASDYITSCVTGQIVYCWIFGTKKPPVSGAKSLTNLQ
ncbi:phage antirepressor N-terminal domain-containing protein [uncultured Tolumonas sp.]|uniref:phage antirepressor N-terminal domain-containing protein n=1 Tax=uncultured Tolumonas sp. TaxID=263765 RepID=UPI002A0A3CBA|nr:phage antirepressor N-terminal domain-containing protein [uncultured Tolumonas sp.]